MRGAVDFAARVNVHLRTLAFRVASFACSVSTSESWVRNVSQAGVLVAVMSMDGYY
jgi:hypothetical protein